MVDKWIGKLAVVTGASAGIGAAIFEHLAKAGINVIGLARRSEKVEELIKKIGPTKGKTFAYKCDVSDPKSIKETFKWIEGKFGVVNILVNNAGAGRNAHLLDPSDKATELMDEVINTNFRGLTQCTREAYRLMKKSDDYGYIININSVVGHYVPIMPMPTNVYPATKYAVTALTESIRHELIFADNKKVRITSLSPGFVTTEALVASGMMTAEQLDSPENPMRSEPALESSDIAHSILFLLSTPYSVNVTELTVRPTGEKF